MDKRIVGHVIKNGKMKSVWLVGSSDVPVDGVAITHFSDPETAPFIREAVRLGGLAIKYRHGADEEPDLVMHVRTNNGWRLKRIGGISPAPGELIDVPPRPMTEERKREYESYRLWQEGTKASQLGLL